MDPLAQFNMAELRQLYDPNGVNQQLLENSVSNPVDSIASSSRRNNAVGK